jgi:hypothetical protein
MPNASPEAPDKLHDGAPRPVNRRDGAGRRRDGDGTPGRIKPRKAARGTRQPRVAPPEPAAVPADVAAPEPSVDADDLLQSGGAPGDAGPLTDEQDLADAGILEEPKPPLGFDFVKHPYVAVRPMRCGERMLNPGESVPGAESWPRLETWVQYRKIRPRRR